jgi:protocatechuate 3,4-dioxygenase beta subunit
MMFSSDSCGLEHIKLHHSEYVQVARQKNLSVPSVLRCFEPAQHRQFNVNNDSVKDLDMLPYLKHVENIADSESQPPPPPLLLTRLYRGTGAPLRDFIAALWECDAQGCLQTNLQTHLTARL